MPVFNKFMFHKYDVQVLRMSIFESIFLNTKKNITSKNITALFLKNAHSLMNSVHSVNSRMNT